MHSTGKEINKKPPVVKRGDLTWGDKCQDRKRKKEVRDKFFRLIYPHRQELLAKKRKVAAELFWAIRRGDVKRGPCSVCGTSAKLEAHHEDYDKPLDVVWFCHKHHRERHIQIRASYGGGVYAQYAAAVGEEAVRLWIEYQQLSEKVK